MRYKVGDKVRLRKELKQGAKYKGILFVFEMEKFKKKIGIINHISKENGEEYYKIKEFYDCWYSDEMLEPVAKSIADSDENKDEVVDSFDRSIDKNGQKDKKVRSKTDNLQKKILNLEMLLL